MKLLSSLCLAAALALAGGPAALAKSPDSVKIVQSAAGPGAPAAFQYRTGQGYSLPPSLLVATSSGASLAYTLEVTGDQPDQNGNFLPTATWIPLDPTAVGLTSTSNWQLSGIITAVRANITSYTSGTLTIELVQ